MDRRAFITVLAGSILVAPIVAGTQPLKQPTIGVLVVGAPSSEAFWRLFRDAMRELGYVEGRTVRFEFRSDQGHADRLPELAAELVRLKVDVIVPYFTPAARERAAVGFAGLPRPSYDHALWALRSWLDSWAGIGRVATGMHRQGYDLQLTQYDERGWRATCYTTGIEHSPTSATGTAWERTPWYATQRAVWRALRAAARAG